MRKEAIDVTRKALIVEDNEANMELAAVLLEIGGFVVLQATTAEIGIELARSESPDVIVMDIGLPGMDGLEATRLLKADSALRATPIVVTTSHAMKGDREKAFEAGCDGYITKPIDTRTFAEEIVSILSSPSESEGTT
jgi:CheY-like chemotaxis protein